MDHFHFIGIKGSGMSALAQILCDLGHQVQGEDIESSLYTQLPLASRNIPLYPFGHAPLSEHLRVIASNAYDDYHPAIVRCKQHGLPVHRYHHFLGDWINGYTSIAVTGAHGKTTTTGLMAHALQAAEPVCALIGDGTGTAAANARLFVFESCEYRRHFLAYRPDIAVITNIDFDHPDYFADIDDVRRAFEEMADLTKSQLIACGDDPQIRLLKTTKDTLYYGFGADNELRASKLLTEDTGVTFEVSFKGTTINRFSIPAFGKHNVLNALSVIGVALVLGLDLDMLKSQLASFAGVKRRFTEMHRGSNVVIDDYAHHPSEIRATLEAVRSKYPHKQVVGIFQPHTYSRLEKLIDDFALALQEADQLYLCPVFGSARESGGRISVNDLKQRIPQARLITGNFAADLSAYEDSVLLFMGAGDIQKYQNLLVQA
jgi:UDP-N-acetylmuramate--alanine ligase